MTPLAESHDALLLDLDGTIYLGERIIPHVVDVLIDATARGSRPMFVTNNASRLPAEVATALNGMGVAAQGTDVLTSPEAAATMLAQAHPAGAAVLVVGAAALSAAVTDVGLLPVRLAAEQPVAVVQGHSPDTGWRELAEACIALRAGADWVASNTDTTLPTDRGLLPGNGAMVAALKAATGRTPRVAGKPNRPLLDEAVHRSGAKRPLVVGDRLDTDIEAAVLADMPSLMVLTGVSTCADLLRASACRRPSFVSFDLRGLVDENRVAALSAGSDAVDDRTWTVSEEAGELVLVASDKNADMDDGDHLRALVLLAHRMWSTQVTAVRPGDDAASAALTHLGLADRVLADEDAG